VLQQGTDGASGGANHLAGIDFAMRSGIKWTYIPYKGGSQAITDVMAGQAQVLFNGMLATFPFVKEGKLRAIAISSAKRFAAAPEIPTVDEAGLPGFYFTFWAGLWAPKGTPKDVIAKLNSAAVTALADPTIRSRFTDLGFEIYSRDQQTPEALAAYQKAEIEKWWPIIKEFGIKVE